MDKTEFDDYVDVYELHMDNTIPKILNDDLYFSEYKIKLISKLCKDKKIKKILDYGCGSGRSIQFLEQYFKGSEIYGFDVSVESIRVASKENNYAKFFSSIDEIKNESFDLILSANVFHHIKPEEQSDALHACYEMLSDQGEFFIFEHNPINPATRWIFEKCPLDIDAEMIGMNKLLVKGLSTKFKLNKKGYCLFFPKPLKFFRPLEYFMSFLPLGAQYYLDFKK